MIRTLVAMVLITGACEPGPKSKPEPSIDWTAALSDGDPVRRCEACLHFGKVRDGEAVGRIIEILFKDPTPDVRRCAERALVSIGERRVVDPMLAMVKKDGLRDSEKRDLVSSALRILAELRDPGSIKHLVDILRDNADDDVETDLLRSRVIYALVKFGPGVFEPVSTLLDEKGFKPKLAALGILRELVLDGHRAPPQVIAKVQTMTIPSDQGLLKPEAEQALKVLESQSKPR
jgi:HEAT repeat protein